MIKLINQEVIVTPQSRELIFYLLDTDDFVVDALTYGELVQILSTGQVSVEHMLFSPNRGIYGSKIVQGILPKRFKHWSIRNKMILLHMQKNGACLDLNDESSSFYASSPVPDEEDLDIECAKLINFTTMRNLHHRFNIYGDFYICADANGFFHLVYRNITHKLELSFDIDIRAHAPNMINLYEGDRNNSILNGGFTELEVFDTTNGIICVSVIGSASKGVCYKLDLGKLNKSINTYIETGSIVKVNWEMYASQS